MGKKKQFTQQPDEAGLPEPFPADLLQQSEAARQAHFERCLIEHTHLQDACDAVIRAICMPGEDISYRRLGCMVLLIGPMRVGKTTLIDLLQQELLRRAQKRMQSDPSYIPFVSITTDGSGTGRFDWKDYYLAILEQLHDPFLNVKKPSVSARDLREATEMALLRRKTDVVIVDEAHHLAKARSGSRLQDHLDHLKYFENKTGVSHVLVGTYEMRPFRKVNAQLACRSVDVHFARYDATKQDEREIFKSALWALQRQLPVQEEPQLVQNHWEYLYARSLGCIGLLKQHLNQALRLALDEKAKTVTLAHLRKTALHKEKADLALEAILDGEGDFAEAEDADQDLLEQLGMVPSEPTTKQEDTPATEQPVQQTPTHRRQKLQLGERAPGRDPIGSGEEAHQKENSNEARRAAG